MSCWSGHVLAVLLLICAIYPTPQIPCFCFVFYVVVVVLIVFVFVFFLYLVLCLFWIRFSHDIENYQISVYVIHLSPRPVGR